MIKIPWSKISQNIYKNKIVFIIKGEKRFLNDFKMKNRERNSSYIQINQEKISKTMEKSEMN